MRNQTMRFSFSRHVLSLAVFGLVAAMFFGTPHRKPWAPVSLEAQYTGSNPLAYWVPPGACQNWNPSNTTGTNGLTTEASGGQHTPVVQASTSSAGTNTHHYVCNISPPTWIVSTVNGFAIVDAVFVYSVQATLGTQSASLTSGTLNSTTVFTSLGLPTPGTSETAASVPARAQDGGSIILTPTAANFNVTSTGAGQYVTQKFAPTTPIPWRTDQWNLYLNVDLLNTASTATITTTPGVLVHFKGQ